LLCGAKTNQNPENAVGILAAAGDRIEVMVTPTSDLGRLVTELNKVQIGGNADLLRGIQTAQLALKHRQNKKQKQRIIAFVGSPVTATEKELEALGKNLKKNSVALDLVSFGEVEENAPKLEKLMNALNSNDTSHLLEAPVGPKLLSDVLLSSPIINPDGEAGGGDGGAGFEFGINPQEDPELALALRISMEEERARQQAVEGGDGAAAASAAEAPQAAATATDAAPAAAAPATSAPAPDAAVMEAMGMEDMDDELRQALLLSMQEMEPGAADPPAPKRKAEEMEAPAAAKDAEMPAEEKAADSSEPSLDSRWLQDPSFVQELLGSLPGVDINDERIQEALKEVSGASQDKKDGSSSDKKEDPK
jgi:26S proteasome regulatory subunit N10